VVRRPLTTPIGWGSKFFSNVFPFLESGRSGSPNDMPGTTQLKIFLRLIMKWNTSDLSAHRRNREGGTDLHSAEVVSSQSLALTSRQQ